RRERRHRGRLFLFHEAHRGALRALGPKDFALTLSIPGAAPHEYELRGDEWQIDARVLKWRAIGTVIGFDTVYRLERLSGRYADAGQELSELRTVYPLWHTPRLDLWQLARRYHEYLPFADALYGSAAYVPMADGAQYVVTVTASGLAVRPQNEAARRAVGDWR
ncbi:MAG: hypothetical protein WCA17_01975, partial [Burkholderiales bacterium]